MTRAVITREGDEVVIRLPRDDVQALRVALERCPCRAPKTISTEDIRQRLVNGLGRAISHRFAQTGGS